MRNSLIICQITYKKFATPNIIIITKTNSIETNSDNFFIKIMFCHTGSNMCMVMLYFNNRQSGVNSIFCRKILRVHIISHDFRFNTK